MRSKIARYGVAAGCLMCSFLSAQAQQWRMIRENVQKHFTHLVPPGNYSGITHLHDDVYAVVSDKSDSALYFNFKVQVNPQTGELERVESLGFTEYVDGTGKSDSLLWHGKDAGGGYDHEAIAKVSDSTLVVASEGRFWLREYPIRDGHSAVANHKAKFWMDKWPSSLFYPNYVFESLAFDSINKRLWTIPESTLRADGPLATPQNGLANKLRLFSYDWQKEKSTDATDTENKQDDMLCYAYLMDKPSVRKKAEMYIMGVSELCVLPDGQLLVLEREAFIPKLKLGAFCRCKLYVIDPLHGKPIAPSSPLDAHAPYLEKRLLAEWKTGLSLFDCSFANYEGMCLGPKLQDGSQVVILLSDSQDQYRGVLKDWFKTIILSK